MKARALVEQILVQVQLLRPKAVILDFSVIPLVDSFLSKALFEVGKSLQLMGTKFIITGIPNEVIVTMVELGIKSRDLKTARDIDEALKII